MLAVSRRRDESVIIRDEQGTQARVKVLEFKDDGFGHRVVLGISAPREWPIYREELLDNLDALAALRAAFDDTPEPARKRFLSEMGSHLLAKTTHEMLAGFVRALEQLGLVRVEQRPDGKTVFESSFSETETAEQA